MITQNNLVEFAAKLSSIPMPGRKETTPDKNQFPQFKDFLEKAKSSGVFKDNPAAVKPRESSKESTVQINDRQPQVKSYKEAEKTNVQEQKTQKTEKDSDTPKDFNSVKEAVEKQDIDKEKKVQADAVVGILANALSLKPGELEMVLKSLNIKPEDLTDYSKLAEVAEKLIVAFGLKADQKNVLVDVIKSIKDQVATSLANKDAVYPKTVQKQDGTGEENNKKWVKLDNVDVKVTVVPEKPAGFEEIMAGFKPRLAELLNKYQNNRQQFTEQVSQQLKTMLAQMQPEEKTSPVVTDTEKVKDSTLKVNNGGDEKENEKPVKEAKTADAGSAKEDTKKEDEQQLDLKGKSDNEATPAVRNTAEKADDRGNVQFNNTLADQIQKNAGVDETAKTQRSVHIPKNEIVSQVVEKAKVVVSGEKSEMMMDLKPDYLGKLSLKVVTENGIVMAKFVAESHQVKEILETNMQLLKDTLEKQGLVVQDFSVSVGQDSWQGFNREGRYEGRSLAGGSKTEAGGIKVFSTTGALDGQSKVNPYNLNDNRINLTA